MLAVLAALPAAALGGLTVFASHREAPVSVPATSSTVAASLPPVLDTPLLSVRRAPTPLADTRRTDLLQASVQQLVAGVDATSCLAVGLDDRPLVATNDTLPVIPASNLKVVTATAAVEILGAGTVFTTRVVGPAPVDGVVDGDIYLVGGGDPVLSEQWYTEITESHKRPPLHPTSIEGLADALKSAGVTSITGRVLGDGTRYDDERHPPGWSDSIRASVDGVPVGALVVNDSVSQSGGIANDPAASAAKVFRRLLRDRGISIGGDSGTGQAPTDAGVLATATSAPLSQLVNEMLATSDNLTAEMLVKEMGIATAQQGTRSAGLAAMASKMAEWGVTAEQFVFTDGSGLSRDNRLTCGALLSVLQRGSATDVVGSGLAKAGDDGSTLDGRFEQDGLKGVLQAKTGSLTGVKALCGYFPMASGEVEFVLILNGDSAAGFAGPWDLLGQALLAVAAAPSADSLSP